jgi:hypothetical protein
MNEVDDIFPLDDVFEFAPESDEDVLLSHPADNQTFITENVVFSIEMQLKISNWRAYLYLGL